MLCVQGKNVFTSLSRRHQREFQMALSWKRARHVEEELTVGRCLAASRRCLLAMLMLSCARTVSTGICGSTSQLPCSWSGCEFSLHGGADNLDTLQRTGNCSSSSNSSLILRGLGIASLSPDVFEGISPSITYVPLRPGIRSSRRDALHCCVHSCALL